MSVVFKPTGTAQKMKFSVTDFFSKCDQIRRQLRIWSHLLKKSLKENYFFMQCGGLPNTNTRAYFLKLTQPSRTKLITGKKHFRI